MSDTTSPVLLIAPLSDQLPPIFPGGQTAAHGSELLHLDPMPDDPINALAQGPLYWFRDWPNQAVPTFCAGVYTIWHSDGRFVYVGMSGRSIKSESVPGPLPYGLHTRLSSHFSGRRSGDQFCVYVADRLVLSDLTPANIEDISSGRHPMDVPFGPISMQVWDTGLRSSQPDKPPSKLKGRLGKGSGHMANHSSTPSRASAMSSR